MYIIYAAIVYAIYLFISSYFDKIKEVKETTQRYYKLSEQNKINESYLAKYNSMFSHLDSKIIRKIQSEEIYKYSLLFTKVSDRQLDKYISRIIDNRKRELN